MTNLRKLSHTPLLEILLIFVLAVVTYLPHLSQATIYRDDWYYTMDRLIGGPGVFQDMFSIDRPARGPLFEAYYQLFGIHPFPYHMMSFLWRVAGGFAALWLFRQLWPRQRLATFLMALLFALYPGYLRWMEGFEDQPRILSSFLEALSIGLTLQAIRTPRMMPKILWWIGSILTGWAYIALVDFAFGMEVFRLLCVFLVVNRDQRALSLINRSIATVRAWGVAALIPIGFLFWRLFLFHNERQATDVGLQLSSFAVSPLLTGLWWLARLFQSAVNVAVLAWSAPLFSSLFEFGLSTLMIGVLIAVGAAALLLWGIFSIWNREAGNEHQSDLGEGWQLEAIWIGLAGVIVGVLPVVLANRYVTLGGYSHYALPASLASVTFVVGMISCINSRNVRFAVASALVFLAVLTHYSTSWQVLSEEQTIANFWQQMVWRAPGIKSGTTLVVNYPSIDYAEDVDAVAGPANFLYFPEQTNQIPAVYQLVALPQMDYTIKDVLAGKIKSYGYRTHIGEIDYGNMLVISQPAQNACVHVINSQWPIYSEQDSNQILLLGGYSKVENVLTDVPAPRPAQFIFGRQPAQAQAWCYYYQQAELALQEGNWEKIVRLEDQAAKLKLTPHDPMEWAPFLQAYASQGDEKAFKRIALNMSTSLFVRGEACRTMMKMEEMGTAFTSQIQSLIDERLCRVRQN